VSRHKGAVGNDNASWFLALARTSVKFGVSGLETVFSLPPGFRDAFDMCMKAGFRDAFDMCMKAGFRDAFDMCMKAKKNRH